MKTIFKISLITLFSLFLIQPVQGQKLLNRLKKKVEERVEKKVEERVEKKANEKIDEKIDEGLDKIEDSLENKEGKEENDSSDSNAESDSGENKTEQRLQSIMKGLGMSGEPVPIEDNYSFNQSIKMHVESYDKSGEKTSDGEFITHLNSKAKSMAYQVLSGDMAKQGVGMFIMDAENQAAIMLSEENGRKTGIVYGMGSFFQTMGETYNEEDVDLSDSPETYLANPNVKKTGRTKTIAGYKCEEYTYKDEDTESNYWITKKLKMNTDDYFSTLFKTSMYTQGMGWGYMMEAISVDKESGDKTIMQVTDVDTNSKIKFNLKNYQITNLGSINLPTE